VAAQPEPNLRERRVYALAIDDERPYVAVVGGGRARAEELTAAEAVGAALAQRGAVVVCGGRGGVMEAACRGAKSAGGATLGILPGATRADANRWVDVAVATGLGEARNALVVRAADAVIAVGGEFGTLSEIALALKLGKRVVGISTWRLDRPGAAADPIVRAGDATEAVEAALR
jgi:uncharacterized protein (TIGR00725 family)